MATEKKRANSVITTEVLDEGKTLAFNVLGVGQLTLDLTALHPDIVARAVLHGMKQRVSDAAAIPCDAETGKPASAQDKYDAMAQLVEHYNSGTADWAVRVAREGGGGAGGKESKTLRAIANVYGLDVAGARGYVEKTAEKRGIEYAKALALWRGSDKIREELARMDAAQPAKVDADSLLEELN